MCCVHWFVQVLDAPALADDFYLNLVDWSAQNLLAVGLDSCVYLWSAHTSKVGGGACLEGQGLGCVCVYVLVELACKKVTWLVTVRRE